MEISIVVILLGTGLVNGIPVVGVAGAGWLGRLYGVPIADPDVLVLMRHRALRLGLLGAALVAAVFAPALRLPAMIARLVSMLAFVGLATGPSGRKVRTTAVVDVGLSAALAVALLLHLVSPSPVG